MKFEDVKPGMIVRMIKPFQETNPETYAVAYLREQRQFQIRPGVFESAWFGFWITPKLGGIHWPRYAGWKNWEPVEL